MKKYFVILLACLLLAGCSQTFSTFYITNKSDFDVTLCNDNFEYLCKSGEYKEVEGTLKSVWNIKEENAPARLVQGNHVINIINDYNLTNLTIINNTNDDINFKITNNFYTDFSINKKTKLVKKIYTSSPEIETTHLNYILSKNSNELFLTFN